MNMLVDGEWRTDMFQATNEEGAFERQTTPFRNWIAGSDVPEHIEAEPDDRFEAEAGRYHLYVSYACPWAHRTLLIRALMGLEDAIDISVVDPIATMTAGSSPREGGCTEDKLYRSDYLRELYVEADPDATCRVTVPVLWDTKEETIVNNESREIIRMLSTGFGDVAEQDVDLAPEAIREEVDGSSPISTSRSTTGSTGPDSRPNRAPTTRPSTNCSTPSTTGIRSSKTNGSSLATS